MGGGQNRLLLKDGTEETAQLHPGAPARSSWKGVLGHIDGDGCLDLDLCIANSTDEGGDEVLFIAD